MKGSSLLSAYILVTAVGLMFIAGSFTQVDAEMIFEDGFESGTLDSDK